MLSSEPVYVGVDPTAGVRPMHYAAVDGDLRLVAFGESNLEGILAFIAGLERAVVAIDAPQSPNRGLMLQAEVRQRYNLPAGGKTWGVWKVAEYELRRRNIRLYNTPASEDDAPRWMRHGFQLYRRLLSMDYRFFIAGDRPEPRAMVEVHPHACFTVLLGHRPFLKASLEGRLQRQLVLYLQGLDVPDPMQIFEEITRHHLLAGELDLDGLLQHDQLDALAAAYTAFLTAARPDQVCQVGDREEGLITLPAGDLKDFYR